MSEVSLSDLQTKLDAMTPGTYEVAGPYPIVSIYVERVFEDEFPVQICDVFEPACFRDQPPPQAVWDATGIVAFHNAAQLLLDVAKAAQALASTSPGRWEEAAARDKLLIACGKLRP